MHLRVSALRILGKMGGRNRRVLRQPPTLRYSDEQAPGMLMLLMFCPVMVELYIHAISRAIILKYNLGIFLLLISIN
jgi:hypothetical protein